MGLCLGRAAGAPGPLGLVLETKAVSLEDACTFIFTSHGLIYLADKKEIKSCLKLASPQQGYQPESGPGIILVGPGFPLCSC
ncbi:hypothetical protein AV530_002032 [Patagioenas fasciata monilis]|nr:hypothetical protein AV530_002032 [Patagioenas fasciata monilis]